MFCFLKNPLLQFTTGGNPVKARFREWAPKKCSSEGNWALAGWNTAPPSLLVLHPVRIMIRSLFCQGLQSFFAWILLVTLSYGHYGQGDLKLRQPWSDRLSVHASVQLAVDW